MLQPKRTKYRKQMRGRMKGKASRGTEVTFGDYGLQALEPAWVTARQIEAGRRAIVRHVRRRGKYWIRIFPDKPVTAKPAETRMGKSSMGKHRGTGMGPGRYMPLEMRNIGWGMHEAATEFSQLAKKGDTKNAYVALQKITGSCVACHYAYRTR